LHQNVTNSNSISITFNLKSFTRIRKLQQWRVSKLVP
jgi:hypothetical protein